MRGTARFRRIRGNLSRITPACAGNRSLQFGKCAAGQDHPRVCGEQIVIIPLHLEMLGSPPRVRGTDIPAMLAGARKWGSPPRVRGTVISFSLIEINRRITPACAGNSRARSLRPGHGQDHPRVCGEQGQAGSLTAPMEGSPPRVRGTDAALRQRDMGYRITPACAGNRAPITMWT